MSVAQAEVFVPREAVNAALDPKRTESKFSLAVNAVTKSKDYAEQSVGSYLEALLEVLNSFPVVQSREGAFDARILVTVDASKRFVDEYRTLLVEIAEADDSERYTAGLITFLEGVLELKRHFPLENTAAYLWLDALSFLAREIFLSTIAPLIARHRWSVVQRLITHPYVTSACAEGTRFHAFDSFQRSLDVFRKRRLKLSRVSVSADILKNRVDATGVSFEHVMQADLVLHLVTLFNQGALRESWFARTLCYAEEYIQSGFDLFVCARGNTADGFLNELFGVADWAQFSARLKELARTSMISQADTLDYQGFIAANTAIFDPKAGLS